MENSDPLVETLHEWFDIFRRSLLGNFFTFARNNGLTIGQFGAMLRIFHKGACGVSDIGSDLGVTNSAASQMLERLVQLQLVTRSENPDDRRVRQIVLTEKGRNILQQSSMAFHAWMEELAGSMTPEEREHVKKALTILIEKARLLETSNN